MLPNKQRGLCPIGDRSSCHQFLDMVHMGCHRSLNLIDMLHLAPHLVSHHLQILHVLPCQRHFIFGNTLLSSMLVPRSKLFDLTLIQVTQRFKFLLIQCNLIWVRSFRLWFSSPWIPGGAVKISSFCLQFKLWVLPLHFSVIHEKVQNHLDAIQLPIDLRSIQLGILPLKHINKLLIYVLHLIHFVIDHEFLPSQAQELPLQLLLLHLERLLSLYQIHVFFFDPRLFVFDLGLFFPYLLNLRYDILMHLVQLHLVAQSSIVHNCHLAEWIWLLAWVNVRILGLGVSRLLVGILYILVHVHLMMICCYLLNVLRHIVFVDLLEAVILLHQGSLLLLLLILVVVFGASTTNCYRTAGFVDIGVVRGLQRKTRMMHLSIATICFATSSRRLPKSRTNVASDWLFRIVGRMRGDVLNNGMFVDLGHAWVHMISSGSICFASAHVLGIHFVLHGHDGPALFFRVSKVIWHHQTILIGHGLLGVWPHHVARSWPWMLPHRLHLLGCLRALYWRGDVVVCRIALELLHLSSRSKAWRMILSLELLRFLLLLKSILLLHWEGLMLKRIVAQLASLSICASHVLVLDIVLMIGLAITHDSWLLRRLPPLLLLAPWLRERKWLLLVLRKTCSRTARFCLSSPPLVTFWNRRMNDWSTKLLLPAPWILLFITLRIDLIFFRRYLRAVLERMVLKEISVVNLANIEFVDIGMMLLLQRNPGSSCSLLASCAWNLSFVVVFIHHLSVELGIWYVRIEELTLLAMIQLRVVLRSVVHLLLLAVRMADIVFSLMVQVRRIEASRAFALLIAWVQILRAPWLLLMALASASACCSMLPQNSLRRMSWTPLLLPQSIWPVHVQVWRVPGVYIVWRLLVEHILPRAKAWLDINGIDIDLLVAYWLAFSE